MKRVLLNFCLLAFCLKGYSWGFFAHQKINHYSVFLLPPSMLVFYKAHIGFLADHAIDPDKRRYAIAEEGPRHYLDLDHYGVYPFDSLPRQWTKAVVKYGEDSLVKHGIVPWWIQVMLKRLTQAFREKNQSKILRLSADIGHYIADMHVPLHASSNHNGQFTDQKGIHGFWESRLPELLADKEWDFFIGSATYISDPLEFCWQRILESAAASDSVLRIEKELTAQFPADQKYSFEERNGKILRQYSSSFSKTYNEKLNGMVERRMRQSVHAVACFWFTAWVDAGQPSLANMTTLVLSEEALKEFEDLNQAWRTNQMIGRKEDDEE